MILIPFAVGLYLILAVGTFKLLKERTFDSLMEEHGAKTIIYVSISFVSAIWPIGVMWNLLKWAIR